MTQAKAESPKMATAQKIKEENAGKNVGMESQFADHKPKNYFADDYDEDEIEQYESGDYETVDEYDKENDEDDDYDENDYEYYEDEEYDIETLEETESKAEKLAENMADWERYEHVKEGQQCSAPLRFFSKASKRPIVAISSFPGSGNTWAQGLKYLACNL